MKSKKLFSSLIGITASFCLTVAPLSASAQENNQSSSNSLRGDVNSDGVIDSKDAVTVLQHFASVLVGKDALITDTAKGDLNADNLIDSKDAVCILQFYAESIVSSDFSSVNVIDSTTWNNHKYLLCNGLNSGISAMAYCYEQGGYLACIDDESENDFLYKWISSKDCKNTYFGYTDTFSEGNWIWLNGSSSYSNWHKNEPNSENSDEDFAMFYWKFKDGTWNDGDFGKNTNNGGGDTTFICEIG